MAEGGAEAVQNSFAGSDTAKEGCWLPPGQAVRNCRLGEPMCATARELLQPPHCYRASVCTTTRATSEASFVSVLSFSPRSKRSSTEVSPSFIPRGTSCQSSATTRTHRQKCHISILASQVL